MTGNLTANSTTIYVIVYGDMESCFTGETLLLWLFADFCDNALKNAFVRQMLFIVGFFFRTT